MVDSSILVLSDLNRKNQWVTRYQLSPIVDAVVVVDVLLGGSGRVPVSLFSFHFLENLDAVFHLNHAHKIVIKIEKWPDKSPMQWGQEWGTGGRHEYNSYFKSPWRDKRQAQRQQGGLRSRSPFLFLVRFLARGCKMWLLILLWKTYLQCIAILNLDWRCSPHHYGVRHQ